MGNKNSYKNPVGLWKVTTEGDVEGRSTEDLGYWEGNIADIAYELRNKVYYGLQFTPVSIAIHTPKKGKKARSKTSINISLDIDSGTWSDNEVRVKAFTKLLKDVPDVTVAEGDSYSSVKLVYGESAAQKEINKLKKKIAALEGN